MNDRTLQSFSLLGVVVLVFGGIVTFKKGEKGEKGDTEVAVVSNLQEQLKEKDKIIAELKRKTAGVPTPTSTGSTANKPVSRNPYKEEYASKRYPKRNCGKTATKPDYPIFIPIGKDQNGKDLLREVKANFCRDAHLTLDGSDVQVASVGGEAESKQFLKFI